MKRKFKRIVIGLAAIVLCVLIWWLSPAKRPSSKQSVSAQRIEEKKAEGKVVPAASNAADKFEPDKNWKWTNYVPMEHRAGMVDRVKKMSQIVSVANVPIIFYGRILDQHNQPIEGVRVEAVVNSWSVGGIMQHAPARTTNYFVSNAFGDFVIKNMSGETLGFDLQKKDYELAPHSKVSFGYGYGTPEHHEPDPKNPLIYRMWKYEGGAELLSSGFEKKVRADGTPISIDLSNGQVVIGATERPGPTVRIWRSPLIFDYQTSTPDIWGYELSLPGGQMQFTDDVFCYVAPEVGYSEKSKKTIHKGDPDYRFRDKQSFYFINKQGQYGRGLIEIWSDRRGDEALVILSISWNPDGSRNLEPKPE